MAKTRTDAQQKKHDKKVNKNLQHQMTLKTRERPLSGRKVRRAAERYTALEPVHGSPEPKQLSRRPAPILVLFFLDRIKTKVDHKLHKIIDDTGTTSFSSVPVVMIRDIRTKRVKGLRGRMIDEEHYTQWRPFHGAMPISAQDDVSETSQFIGIQAPMTAWAAAGLLDGMVLRDLPREDKREFKRAA